MGNLKFDVFILKKKVTDLEELKNNTDEYCLVLNENLNSIKDIINSDSIDDGILNLDGGVIIEYNYKPLTDFSFWDDLPTLLSYMLNLVEEFKENGQASFYFPSQPMKVELKKEGTKAKFSVHEKSIVVNSDVLIDDILRNTRKFFELLTNELQLSKYQFELDQIESIRK